MQWLRTIVGLLLACCSACTGNVLGDDPPGTDARRSGTPGSLDSGSGSPDDPWQPGLEGSDPDAAGSMPLRGLSREEYDNTVRDLLGDDSRPAADFGGELAAAGYATLAPVSEQSVKDLAAYAETLAAKLDLAALLPCSLSPADESGCVREFVTAFGRGAFRRPLTEPEITDYQELYAALSAEGFAFEDAVRGVVEGLLSSPFFLYHWELGARPAAASGGVIALDSHELASRLSYLLWSSMPDAELSAAADAGTLTNVETLDAQARRLLADPRARDTVRSFTLQWLRLGDVATLNKSPERYPSYTPALGQAMYDEIAQLSNDVVFDGEGTLTALLTTPVAYVDSGLAELYGASYSGSGFVRIELDPGTRPGILTRAAFLSSTSNAYEGDPTKRGIAVREQVICQTLPPPPMNVPPLEPPSPDATVRERHEQHIVDPSCSGCHVLSDYIGFGFGEYDAIGGYQTSEAGKPIDVSGTLSKLDGVDRNFANTAELTSLLAESPEVQGCFVKQWLRFAFKRTEALADNYSLERVYQAFSGSGYSVREMLVALVKSRSFMFRSPAEGEVTQ